MSRVRCTGHSTFQFVDSSSLCGTDLALIPANLSAICRHSALSFSGFLLTCYLLSYDAVSFYNLLETIIASNSQQGAQRDVSQWLMCPAADVLFHESRTRLWTGEIKRGAQDSHQFYSFIPRGINLVLEEPPKWRALLEVLDEIEQDIYSNGAVPQDGAGNTILIMTSSDKSVAQLRSLITKNDGLDSEHPGRPIMMASINDFFAWKQQMKQMKSVSGNSKSDAQQEPPKMSEALSQKNELPRSGAPTHKRRRVRGGMPAPAQTHGEHKISQMVNQEADSLADTEVEAIPDVEILSSSKISLDPAANYSLGDYFGVVDIENVVIVRKYDRDDDTMLQELRPRYVIMYEPNPAFIRHIEVYRSMEEVQLKVFFMMYTDSVEEHMYLGSLRREKDSFEKLIRQKGTMALPLTTENEPAEDDVDQRFLRTISSRVAGAQRVATNKTPTVVVDMREFRSSLPSLLHATGLQVIPCTLQVGDYVISSEMCVERKSIKDLVQSLISGRLYVDTNELYSVRDNVYSLPIPHLAH